MRYTKVSLLPEATSLDADDFIMFSDMSEIASKKISVLSLVNALAAHDGSSRRLVKCQHCGQWGNERSECKKCGAPIEPA